MICGNNAHALCAIYNVSNSCKEIMVGNIILYYEIIIKGREIYVYITFEKNTVSYSIYYIYLNLLYLI